MNSLANMVEWNMPLFPRFLWVVPLFHCNGWCFPWTMACSAGTSYFLRQMRADQLFYVINKYKLQYFAGAPITMNTMLAYDKKIKFSHEIKMWAAGAPPPTSVIKRFYEEIGIKVQCAYGLTETYGPICTHNIDHDWIYNNEIENNLIVRNNLDISEEKKEKNSDNFNDKNSSTIHQIYNNISTNNDSIKNDNINDINTINNNNDDKADIYTHSIDKYTRSKSNTEISSPSSTSTSSPSSTSTSTWRPLNEHELLLKSTYLSCDTTVESLKVSAGLERTKYL